MRTLLSWRCYGWSFYLRSPLQNIIGQSVAASTSKQNQSVACELHQILPVTSAASGLQSLARRRWKGPARRCPGYHGDDRPVGLQTDDGALVVAVSRHELRACTSAGKVGTDGHRSLEPECTDCRDQKYALKVLRSSLWRAHDNHRGRRSLIGMRGRYRPPYMCLPQKSLLLRNAFQRLRFP